MTSVPWCPHADNNVSLSIPHPAGDPVVAPNKDRVEFLRTTFFDNAAAFKCQLAAICLALRRVSIVRSFTTVGQGGVGQRRNTCLIANLFGGSHTRPGTKGRQAPKAGRHRKPAGTQGRQAPKAGREAPKAGRQAEANKYEQKKRHPHTNTPIRPDTRKPIRIPTRKLELMVSEFNLRNNG